MTGAGTAGRGGSGELDLDLAEVMDALPLSPLQLRVVLLCALVLILDAFDSTSVGFVAPRMSALWHLAPGALGPVFACGFFGQLVGAVIAGPAADRLGRKGVLLAGVLEFGTGALATTQAYSLQSLLILRLITGLGLGAAAPNAVALVTEISPAARRSAMLVVALCGMTIGAATAGVVAARLIPLYGWPSVFWIGGLAPLLLAPLLIWGLTESPYFLALRGGRDGQISAIVRRIDPGIATLGAHFILREERALGVRHLFLHGRALPTTLLLTVVFMNNCLIYVFASWLPSLARASGLTEQASVLTGVAMNVGGLAGTITIGWLLNRFRIERTMAVNYLTAAACIGALALVAGQLSLTGLFAAAAGFCIVGGQLGANALLAYRHPTALRATALSFGLAAGRIASILGPLAAGWIIGLGYSTRATFLFAVLPALCATAAVVGLEARTPLRSPTSAAERTG